MADIRNAYVPTYNLIPGLPQTPYRAGVGAYEGVVAHSVGISDARKAANTDTPTGERNYMANNWNNAFAHAFVGVENGKPVILVTADPQYLAWHCGKVANQRFVSVELCEYDDPALFARSYDAFVWVVAKLLLERNLGVDSAADGSGTLWAHKHVSDCLGGTNHTDPIGYLESHGVSWERFVSDVTHYYCQMDQAHNADRPFPDVPANAWYADAVTELKALAVIKGDGEGNFCPDKPVTRAEMAVLLRRLKIALTAKG